MTVGALVGFLAGASLKRGKGLSAGAGAAGAILGYVVGENVGAPASASSMATPGIPGAPAVPSGEAATLPPAGPATAATSAILRPSPAQQAAVPSRRPTRGRPPDRCCSSRATGCSTPRSGAMHTSP